MVFVILGILVLLVGADQLVRSASRLSLMLGIAPLVVGLTVVAVGTSAPELAVSLTAAWHGTPDMALGNVVGSNIFNTLAILGMAALLRPLLLQQQLIRLDVPVMLGVSGLAWVLAANGVLAIWESALLVAVGGGYIVLLLARRKTFSSQDKPTVERCSRPRDWFWRVLQLGGGVVLLVFGSVWTVRGATALANQWQWDSLVVGLLLLAGATSLPELATSVVAAVRGERDIAVGNVVGSNIVNLLFVLGGTGLVVGQPVDVPQAALQFDIPIMVGVALTCLPIFFTGGRISRLEGGFFVASYGAYLVLLFGLGQHWWPLTKQDLAGVFILAFTGGVLVVSVHRIERHIAQTLLMVAQEAEASIRASWRQVRKLVVLVTGAAVVLAGIALLFLPGPAVVVIPLGLALLGTEFVWARRLLHTMHKQLNTTVRRVRRRN